MTLRSHKNHSSVKAQPYDAGVVAIVVGIVILTVVMWLSPKPKHLQADVNFAQATGNRVGTSLYDMQVSDVQGNIPSDQAFAIGPTERIVMLTLTIANKSTMAQHFFPSRSTFVRDQEGDIFTMHPSMALTHPLQGSDIEAGQTVAGQITFALPKDINKPRLFVDPAWDNTAPAVFNLSL